MKRLNQTGFGLLGVILIIILVAAIGGAGWLVYSNQKDKKAATQEAIVSENTETNSGTALNGYLGIPELGIELKLADGVKDATYAVMADGSSIGLSTESFVDEFGESCNAQSGSVARIFVFVDPEAPDPYSGDGTMSGAFPNAFKSADGTYYAIANNTQDFCAPKQYEKDPDAASAMIKQVRNGFNNTTIQALKQ